MVSDILIFTQGNRRSVDLKMGDYGAFAAELVGDLRAEVEPRAVLIEMDKLPPAVLIRFDSRRLSRVFYNLVHNACDAMTEGGIIYVRFELRGGELVTEIEDTGPGVAPEVADRLFQPFITHGKQHGTGLGLSICKKIVEDHNGRISLRSEPGHGAIFAFTLPLPK